MRSSAAHTTARSALLAILTAVAVSCATSVGPDVRAQDPSPDARPWTDGDTLRIRLGQERSADSGRVAVSFLALVDDSRCPADAICVWEGDASVRVLVRAARVGRQTVLHTRLEPSSVEHGGYVVALAEVAPYPGTLPPDARVVPSILVRIGRP